MDYNITWNFFYNKKKLFNNILMSYEEKNCKKYLLVKRNSFKKY